MEYQKEIKHFEKAIQTFKGDISELSEDESDQLILYSYLIYYAGFPEVIAARHKENDSRSLTIEEIAEITQIMAERVVQKKETPDWISKQAFKLAILLMDKFSTMDGNLQFKPENFPDRWYKFDFEHYDTIMANVAAFYNQVVEKSNWPDIEKQRFQDELLNSLQWEVLLKNQQLLSNSNVLIAFYKHRFRKSKLN